MDVIWRRKIGHILRGKSLLIKVIEGRMMEKDQEEGDYWVC